MDISSIGSLYLKNSAIGGLGGASSSPSASPSSFDILLRAASKAEAAASAREESTTSPVPAHSRPLGAAANAGAKDSAHAGKLRVVIDRTDKLYEQCRELESFVIKNLLEGMRKTVQKSGLMDGGFAGDMYEDMLYDEYATTLSKTAGFGLADQAYLELAGGRGRA